jgi:hypothetical protein
MGSPCLHDLLTQRHRSDSISVFWDEGFIHSLAMVVNEVLNIPCGNDEKWFPEEKREGKW